MSIVINLFTLFAFTLGLAEFQSMGVIDALMLYMNIDKPTAGLFVTLYALGVVFGGPFLTMITARLNVRKVLLSIIFVYGVASTLLLVVSNYWVILAMRFIGGAIHGIFFAIATTTASYIVDKSKLNTAIGKIFSGLTIAMVLGVPAVTFISQYVSFIYAYVAVSVTSFLSFFLLLKYLPKDIPSKNEEVTVGSFFQVLFNPHILLTYLINIFVFGSSFVTYTYFSPITQEITGLDISYMPTILLIFGIGAYIGMTRFGVLADKQGLHKTMLLAIGGFFAVAILFYFFNFQPIAAMVLIFFWGLMCFGFGSIIQGLVMTVGQKALPQYLAIISSLNIAAYNTGISGGSFVGELMVEKHLQLLPAVSALMIAIGGLLYLLHRKVNKSYL